MAKPFKETAAGKIVTKFLPGVATSILENVPGGKIVSGIIDDIIGSGKPISPEELKVLRDYEREMYALEIEDRKTARLREVEIAKAGKSDIMFKITVGVGLSLIVFMAIVIVYFQIPETNKEAFAHFRGIVEGIAISIFSYYVGSSAGSKAKTDILKNK